MHNGVTTWADLDEANERDGHYRRRGHRAHPDARAVEADARKATREMNELIDRYEAGEPLSGEVQRAVERHILYEDALLYMNMLTNGEDCECRPDRVGDCLFCLSKAAYETWKSERNDHANTTTTT